MNTTARTLQAFALAVSCALLGAALLVGCAGPSASKPAKGSVEPTAPPLPVPAVPAPADLSTPEAAVRSYLDWVSYAYRIAVSDVASHTMTPEESVRVDSYMQFNLQERDRRISQKIVEFKLRMATAEATRATLAATEEWRYGYLSRDGHRATSPTYTTSYETTYTLVKLPKGWIVASLDAKPLDEVE